MNRLIILLLAGVFLITCTRPIDNGNFVGEWYVLNFEDEKEYWKINEDNEVLFYNQNNDVTGRYYIEKGIYGSYSEVHRVLISFDKKDTLGFDWVETPSEFPAEIPPDTIRFYHAFVMVRNKKPPKTDLSKKEIVQLLENSFWEYEFENTKFELYLSDSLLNSQEKLAYLKMSGCYEYSSPHQSWTLDTLTNNLVLKFSIGQGRWKEQLLVKEIYQNKLIVDRDDFYWFNKNKVIIRDTSWNFSNMKLTEFNHFYLKDGC